MWPSFRSRSGQTKQPTRCHARLGVEFLEERLAPAMFTVLNTNDSGPDSLRQAILDANGSPGADQITFNIGGGGVQTIAPLSALPTITDAVTIDGTTQLGFAGSPIIELSGASAGSPASGITITAGNSTVRGLVINRFATFGIHLMGNGNNVIAGNFIGTDVTGMSALGNGDAGIMMRNSANNTIGGTTAAARNVVAANGGSGAPNAAHGIVMFLAGATGNIVQGNYVGTNAAGTAALGNVGGGVVLNGGAHHNLVGTDGDGVNDAAEGNLISGGSAHEGAGVILAAAGTNNNRVAGNRIGTDVTGTAALPNNTGVLFYPGPGGNQIGGSPALANTIAFNRFNGVTLLASATTLNNRIQANSIYSNGGLGIDLGNNGFTLNDVLDSDTGPNGLQNFPVIISSTPGATTQIVGHLNSKPSTTYTLDFYANSVADPSGFGEGQSYLGAATVTTDVNGDVHYFAVTVPGASVAGEVISATATDPDGNTSEFSGNRAPTANAGGPYAVSEGQGVALDASASSDPDFDALTYSWDIDGDGVFGDATGMQPTLTWSQLNSLGINDGPQQSSVKVRVDDDAGHVVISPATTLTVTNVVPTVVLAGPTDGVRGQTRTFTLSATDPSSVDESAGFVYAINWGDGSPQQTVGRTPGNGSGVSVDHVFAEAGTYIVVVTATDKDDGASPSASLTATITVLGMQADPCDATRTALVIGGTSGDDHIVFNPGGPGDVQVIFNGVSPGAYSPTGAIIAYGQEGNDDIQVAGSLTQTSWLYGDAGNDRLFGGGGSSILLGGVGDDQLMGGSNRDLMIGGLGADHLVGNGNDDILIGGYTSFDANQVALCALLDEWTSSRDYATRVANLKGTGSGPRANGDYFLKASGVDQTVFDDAAADRMVGSSGKDWIFANLDGGVLDDVSGLLQTELVEELAS
jgi:PKD domain/RTX calcium-binding nonapeptide repeat (4 copies)